MKYKFYILSIFLGIVFAFPALADFKQIQLGTGLFNFYPGLTVNQTNQYIYVQQSFTTLSTSTNISSVSLYLSKDNDNCSGTGWFEIAVCSGETPGNIDQDNYDYPCNGGQVLTQTAWTETVIPDGVSSFYASTTDENNVALSVNASSTYYYDLRWYELNTDNPCIKIYYISNTYAGGRLFAQDKITGGDIYSSIWAREPNSTGATLEWVYPQENWVLNNDTWSDWNLTYNLDTDDLGDWNFLMITSLDVAGRQWIDSGLISSTSEETLWVLNRTHDFLGDVYSGASIFSVNASADCISPTDEGCVYNRIVSADIIHWIASSTSENNIFDNEYTQPYFTPATTTDEGNVLIGWVSAVWETMKIMFPIGLINQMDTIWKDSYKLKNDSAEIINLADLTDDQYDDIASGTLLSANQISSAMPYWNTVIFPWFEIFIYCFNTVFMIIFILLLNHKLS